MLGASCKNMKKAQINKMSNVDPFDDIFGNISNLSGLNQSFPSLPQHNDSSDKAADWHLGDGMCVKVFIFFHLFVVH